MFGIEDNFINKCINTFPHDEQLDFLQEECAELIKACCKMKRTDTNYSLAYNSLKEEITHVLISSAIVSRIYNITEIDIDEEVNKKMRELF